MNTATPTTDTLERAVYRNTGEFPNLDMTALARRFEFVLREIVSENDDGRHHETAGMRSARAMLAKVTP